MKRTSIGDFLPLGRMSEIAQSGPSEYLMGTPFPHIVVDDFFDPSLLDEALAEFPAPGEGAWRRLKNEREIKLLSGAEAFFGSTTRLLLYHLNSKTFLEFLSAVTGIGALLGDPDFLGGGLQQIVRGGKVAIHADFNKHTLYGLDRRLNVIIYLNKGWSDAFGGHLELWDRKMTGAQVKILPVFNRMIVFGSTDFTYHGHPGPLTCPEGMTRKSFALYYYTNGRPKMERSTSHSTLFPEQPRKGFPPLIASGARKVAVELLPPVVTRSLRKILSH